jgi:hypothetical protein
MRGFSRKLDRCFAQTNRLRTEGTDALLAAAREAGVDRFVAQSFASFRYAREGGPVKPVRERQFPIVGDGGIWSFIHLDDAPAATVLALEHDGDVPVGGHRAALPVSAVMNSSMSANG